MSGENITNVSVGPVAASWGGSALGFTEGDTELTFIEDIVDVTAHQEGTNILTGIRTGKRAECTLTLKETNIARVRSILSQGGSLVTASGAASSVVGWGSAKDFTQVLSQANVLKLHPVTKASGDFSEDITFWKAYPKVDTLTFSGENPKMLSVQFLMYPDTTKANAVRLGVVGDANTGNFANVT